MTWLSLPSTQLLQRKKREVEEKVAREKELREKVLLALEDDKIDRKLKAETQRPVGTPGAEHPAAQAPASPRSGSADGSKP